MTRLFTAIVLMLVTGCGGVDPGRTAEPVEISGTVRIKGKPATDAVLNLQPTKGGVQAALHLKGGRFSGKVVPGTYTWYLTDGARPLSPREVPDRFRLGAMDRQIEIDGGTVLLDID